jgi:hypothetical protein
MRKFIIMALLTVYAFSLTVSDIKVMRESDVLIAFPHERKAHTISKNIRPSELIKVSYIRLNDQSLYFVPSWLAKMTNLVRLELKNTKFNLKALVKLKTLTKLNTLDISNNPLFKKGGSLVDFLSNFSLSELYLTNTGGGSSDYSHIGSIGSLIKLDLSGNSISDIDDLELQKLTRLKELLLNNNSISGRLNTEDLPKESLVKLDLSGNNLSTLGFSGDFPSLVTLNISKNRRFMSFAEEYNNPYLFANLEQGKFNKDFALPKSIMKRLGIKSKWIDPSRTVCKKNSGKFDNGRCKAKWKNIENICSDGGGRVPTIEELRKVVTDCGGVIDDFDNNKASSSYQSCYKEKGFTSYYYWSSTTYASDSSYAWSVSFDYGFDYWGDKTGEYSVRCVRGGQ